jgi:hypothetical protein
MPRREFIEVKDGPLVAPVDRVKAKVVPGANFADWEKRRRLRQKVEIPPDISPFIIAQARKTIMNHWLAEGGPSSSLGLPIDSQISAFCDQQGNVCSQFRGGTIKLNDNGDVNITDVRRVTLTLEAIGLLQRQEDGDEIYGTLTVYLGSMGFMKEFVVPEVVLGPSGNNRIQQYSMKIYEGPPADVCIALNLVEHDSGDRNAIRKEVRARVAQIFNESRDLAAGGAGGGALQSVAAALKGESSSEDSLTGWLVGAAGDLVNNVLGMGDDPYNTIGINISAEQMMNIPPTSHFRASDDPRVIDYTDTLIRTTFGHDDAGDIGQITAVFLLQHM